MLPAWLLALPLALTPTWLDGPAPVVGAPSARNPDLAIGGGRVHAVLRARDGGVVHMVTGVGEPFSAAAILPGSASAAKGGGKNYPALAVDELGRAHVAWGPPSAPGNGASYLRVDADGAPIGGAIQGSDRWVESIAVAIADDTVHLVITAIKDAEAPDDADGVFDLRAPIDGGPFVEVEAWPYPNLIEAALAPRDGGLALIGRWDLLKRLNLVGGQWTDFANVALPPGWTSVGRPRYALAGASERWAVIGWQDAIPAGVSVRSGGPKQPWTDLADDVFDPAGPDGEPACALAIGPDDARLVAWLAAAPPRLRVALEIGDWGEPTPMPGTDDATTFALAQESALTYRVVFVTDDGTVHAGLLGVDDGEGDSTTTGDSDGATTDDTTSDAGTTGAGTTSTTDASTTADASESDATTSSTGDAEATSATTSMNPSTASDGAASATFSSGATTGPPSTDGSDDGCACALRSRPAGAGLGLPLLLLSLVRLARRRA
ncbi:MAG: hypothetical protein R3B09_01100 [Nannocystaceae bacterium]